MVSLGKISTRAEIGTIMSVIERDAEMGKLSWEISARYKVPQETADHFMVCLAKLALDGMGARTLGKITKRFTTIAQLRSQIGKSLDTILRGEGQGAAVARDLGGLFGQVRRELDGLQTDIQTRELGGVVEELRTKLGEDLGTLPPRENLKPRPAGPEFHEPPGFLKDAYAKLAGDEPALHRSLEAAQGDPEGAAFLQKALTAEDQNQSGYIAQAQERMRQAKARDEDVENLPKAVAALGRARRKALIDNPDTLEGRRRNQLVAAIPDRQLAQAIARDDFLLLPSAIDELPSLSLFSADPNTPATPLIEAWRRYKAKTQIPDGRDLTPQEARGFASFWRDYLTHETKAYVSERGALWEMSRVEDGRVMKSPKGRAREEGTDFVLAKDDGWLRINDDKAWSSDTVTSVTAFTHKLYEDVLKDVVDMEAAFAATSATMPSPEPALQADLLKARLDVVRYKAFGEDLKALTQSWEKGDAFESANAEKFRALLAKHRVELTVSSHLGRVTRVSERLELLGIKLALPPAIR